MPSNLNNLTPEVFNGLFFTMSTTKHTSTNIWLIHGFGDSGKAYQEVFDSALANHYNLYGVDMPGFGASPRYLNPLF